MISPSFNISALEKTEFHISWAHAAWNKYDGYKVYLYLRPEIWTRYISISDNCRRCTIILLYMLFLFGNLQAKIVPIWRKTSCVCYKYLLINCLWKISTQSHSVPVLSSWRNSVRGRECLSLSKNTANTNNYENSTEDNYSQENPQMLIICQYLQFSRNTT